MKIRSFSPGDLAAKMDWNNRPLHLGIVTEVLDASSTAAILSPTGIEWEYTHDLVHADELLNCN